MQFQIVLGDSARSEKRCSVPCDGVQELTGSIGHARECDSMVTLYLVVTVSQIKGQGSAGLLITREARGTKRYKSHVEG